MGILESRHCDAIVFLGDLLERPEFAAELRDTNIPVVAVWHWTRSKTIPTVNVDNCAGITAALDHLTALRHRRIAFVGDHRIGEAGQREDAYRAYVAGPGLTCAPTSSRTRRKTPSVPAMRLAGCWAWTSRRQRSCVRPMPSPSACCRLPNGGVCAFRRTSRSSASMTPCWRRSARRP